MSDLDQAFVINGDDLRIALSEAPAVGPRELAERILKQHAQPLVDAEKITQAQLAAVLSGFYLDVSHGVSIVKGIVHEPYRVADAVFRQMSANRAHEDPWAPDDDVVDAHVHCEHAPESSAASELEIADQVVRLLQPLGYAGSRRLKRVLRWAWDYLTDGDEPPF